MSAKQISLKSPGTIAVVVVLLAVVAVMNVRTFGGYGSNQKNQQGYRLQAHPPVPSDQAETTHASGTANLGRDPFFPHRKNSGIQAQASRTSKPSSRPTAKPPARRSRTLQCSAIMLGGKSNMAIIDGEGRHLGDKIRGMTITGIDADGVTFRKTNGSTTHLAVGVQEENNLSYRVVTRARKSGDQGRTHLVDK